MTKPPIFQFSSFADKSYIDKLTEAVRRLGGKYDESKIYSPKATHLIVEKMECTEKILCFIAAGKWIVTHSFLKASLGERKFLNEQDYHVSKRFGESKLANVSHKWKQNIDESIKNSPFYNWNVGCMLGDQEKLKALIRIIKAGHGTASVINENHLPKMNSTKFTLIIYDKQTKRLAMSLALKRNLPCYPFQSIPDYIMQCILSDSPVLPMKYYESLEVSISTGNSQFMFSSSYRTLMLCSNKSYIESKTISMELENQFAVLWQNNAFNEALNLVISLEQCELPTVKMLTWFFEFILDKSFKNKVSFSYNLSDREVYDTVYNSVYSYVLHLILNHPPTNKFALDFYREVFNNLAIKFRIQHANESKRIIDVLHLISVHDYIICQSVNAVEAMKSCAFLLLKIENEVTLRKVVEKIVKEKNVSNRTCSKLMEIISFCSSTFEKLDLCTRMETFMAKNSDVGLEKLFLALTE